MFWVVAALFFTAIGIPLYFLPTIIGWKQGPRFAIFALNLVFGWTVVGWVALILWTLSYGAHGSANIQSQIAGATGLAEFCDECEHYSQPGSRSCCHCGKPFESRAA